MTDPVTRPAIDLGTGTAVGRIVVPLTLEHRYDRGVAAAAAFAERFGLPVRLVNVDVGDPDTVDLQQGERLDAARAALVAAHPAIEVDDLVLAATDDPARALADALEPQDLVILASSADEGPAGAFGQHLVGYAGTPVMLLGPQATLGDLEGDVIVGVDGSVLAERCIPVATGMAAALGNDLKLVEAVPRIVVEHISSLRQRGERVSENAYLRDLVDRLGDPTMSWEVVHHDDPALALVDATQRAGGSMIVMSTHGREGFVAQVFGSIALATVRHATCPVLLQRPVTDAPEAITS